MPVFNEESHLSLLHLLSRGLDPECRVQVSHNRPETAPLIDLLRVPDTVRGPIGPCLAVQRKGLSAEINFNSRQNSRLAFFSAFEPGLWAATAKGRDLAEFKERTKVEAELASLTQQIPDYSPDDLLVERAQREEIIKRSWQDASQSRLAHWLEDS